MNDFRFKWITAFLLSAILTLMFLDGLRWKKDINSMSLRILAIEADSRQSAHCAISALDQVESFIEEHSGDTATLIMRQQYKAKIHNKAIKK